jgi:hypothetical protein
MRKRLDGSKDPLPDPASARVQGANEYCNRIGLSMPHRRLKIARADKETQGIAQDACTSDRDHHLP